jgi:hypothetical protein
MKTSAIISGSIIVLFSSCASEIKILVSDVPQAVISSFQVKYPAASAVEWEAEKADGHLAFEAEFRENGKSKEAYFKPDGTFLKEE